MGNPSDKHREQLNLLRKQARKTKKLSKESDTTNNIMNDGSKLTVEEININGQKNMVQRVMLPQARYRIGWVCDSDAPACMRCIRPFSFFFRRHHCRLCGFVVCGYCSDVRMEITMLEEVGGSRICEQCIQRQSLANYVLQPGEKRGISRSSGGTASYGPSVDSNTSTLGRHTDYTTTRDTMSEQYPTIFRDSDELDPDPKEFYMDGSRTASQQMSYNSSMSSNIRPSFLSNIAPLPRPLPLASESSSGGDGKENQGIAAVSDVATSTPCNNSEGDVAMSQERQPSQPSDPKGWMKDSTISQSSMHSLESIATSGSGTLTPNTSVLSVSTCDSTTALSKGKSGKKGRKNGNSGKNGRNISDRNSIDGHDAIVQKEVANEHSNDKRSPDGNNSMNGDLEALRQSDLTDNTRDSACSNNTRNSTRKKGKKNNKRWTGK